MDLTGKNALVTGGSRGIGRAVCLELARLGANVAVNYAGNAQAAEETAAACRALGVNAFPVRADVSNAGEVDAMVKTVIETFGSLHILVNNAGITKDKLALQMKEEEFDAVVIIRGGGSASDLNCFNAYRLCTHVAQFPLPVLTGIGHDKDTSVADMVAHTALKTPTAVAGWLVERMDTIDAWLDNAALQLRDNVLVTSRAQELRLQELSSHLLFHAKGLLRQRGMALEQMRETLAASAGNFLARQASRLGNAAELVAGRSPERILRLGFAIVRTDGKAVFSAAQVGKGDTLDIEVADGRIEGTVQYTETK